LEETHTLSQFEKAFVDAVLLQLVEEKTITTSQFNGISIYLKDFATGNEKPDGSDAKHTGKTKKKH
jgi:hypothetical protein